MTQLFLVFGGLLNDPQTMDFQDPSNLDIIGIFTSEEEARNAWRAAAQKTVDNALIRYFVSDISNCRDGNKNAAA